MTASEVREPPLYWPIVSELRQHHYDTRSRGSRPDDPGWHVCWCGWEGYWCDWQPHVAERIALALQAAAGPWAHHQTHIIFPGDTREHTADGTACPCGMTPETNGLRHIRGRYLHNPPPRVPGA